MPPRPVGQVASGELSSRDRAELDRAIRDAEQTSRFEFSVFRGATEGDPRQFARRLHATLSTPERSVLVVVDPTSRVIEVVTGLEVRRNLTDPEVELAVLAMQTAFSQGDHVGGIKRGLALLADYARAPKTLHFD